MEKITDNERRVLQSIADSHYGEGPGDPIWLEAINHSNSPSGIEGKALSGVCASLHKKGLVESDDECIWITEAGEKFLS